MVYNDIIVSLEFISISNSILNGSQNAFNGFKMQSLENKATFN